jgi:hypothetical protein
VRWLGDSRDETELRVRACLDAAATRNDDLALRRAWSRLCDLLPISSQGRGRGRFGRLRWSFLLTAAALMGGVVAGTLLLRPLMRDAPDRGSDTASTRPAATDATAKTAFKTAPRTAVEGRAVPSRASVRQEDPASLLVGPTLIRTGAREERSVRLMSGARVDLGSHSALSVDAGQRPVLLRGRAQLEVPKQPRGEPFSVTAGPYVVVVMGTKFTLGVSDRDVSVEVREGLVQVWRGGQATRLDAGASWRGPTRLQNFTAHRRSRGVLVPGARQSAPALNPAGSTQHSADLYQEAMGAVKRGDTMIALSLLRQAARGTGPAAENSDFAIGALLRDHLFQPRQAVEAWAGYRQRHPRGLLRQEADLSIIETLLELGDRVAARREVEAFLRLHPGSEWYGQMATLAGKLAGNRTPAEGVEPASGNTKDSTSGAGRGLGGPSAMRAY